MQSEQAITCKVTSWFLTRAFIGIIMFSVFASWFYLDGSRGYREKNYHFFLNQTFQKAQQHFNDQQSKNTLNAESWKSFAAKQSIQLPQDLSILPQEINKSWPSILQDYQKMNQGKWNLLWNEFTKEKEWDVQVIEHPYDAQKIHEQWVVMYICIACIFVVLFFIIRNSMRSLSVNHQSFQAVNGAVISFPQMKQLDLRKWQTKGLAFLTYEKDNKLLKTRIDGFIYGGFNPQQNAPAEQLMSYLKQHFSGEILEYQQDELSEPTSQP